jgi:hypothetical protein
MHCSPNLQMFTASRLGRTPYFFWRPRLQRPTKNKTRRAQLHSISWHMKPMGVEFIAEQRVRCWIRDASPELAPQLEALEASRNVNPAELSIDMA